ncbi:MAG: hypothetical protein EKK43_14475 [Methylobacterium sp.]|uniref:hypothetical protein n=1 Tax=Methylobacterium sp. TaxID=409 RepID=UPI000FB13A0D|nr:hypothetical protein [Methylobacterium sp.]RUP13900.1 MAG: hypothetical protein EKK43_14475 [Methylobacterium sp.]
MSFSDPVQKRQANGEVGSDRTRGILGTDVEILQSNIDVDGADHIIRIPTASIDERREKNLSISVEGILQSKFFENRNAVKIAEKYAIQNGGPRKNFFVLIHTNDASGEPVRYFLTANDVLLLPATSDGLYRRFAISDGDDKSRYSSISRRDIIWTIVHNIALCEKEAADKYIEIIRRNALLNFELRAGWQARLPTTKYYLKNITLVEADDGTEPVIGKAVFAVVEGDRVPRAIDARWDLYSAAQTWAWGYGGTGPHLLAASILGHYLRGSAPTSHMIRNFVTFLLGILPEGKDHVITGGDIENIISPDVVS